MLASMTPELLWDHEYMIVSDMISSLKSMFQLLIRHMRREIVRALNACRMTEGSSISTYILKMKGLTDRMNYLGFALGQELKTGSGS